MKQGFIDNIDCISYSFFSSFPKYRKIQLNHIGTMKKPLILKIEVDYNVLPTHAMTGKHRFDASTHRLAKIHFEHLSQKATEFHGALPPSTSRFIRLFQIPTPLSVWCAEGISHDHAPMGMKEPLNVWDLFALAFELYQRSLSPETIETDLTGHILAFRSVLPYRTHVLANGQIRSHDVEYIPALNIKDGVPLSIYHIESHYEGHVIEPIIGATSCGVNLASGAKLGIDGQTEVQLPIVPEVQSRASRRLLKQLMQTSGAPVSQ